MFLLSFLLSCTYLGKHLELLPPLVEVDESVGDLVWDGGVDHGEICEEGAEVGDGAVTGEGVMLHGRARVQEDQRLSVQIYGVQKLLLAAT